MKRIVFFVCMSILITAVMNGTAVHARDVKHDEQSVQTSETPRYGFAYAVGKHPVIMYIPNRIFDFLDILRVRVRIGPGFSIGARATELADIFAGSHATIFAGLRGTRCKPEIPWPIGLEKNEGFEISIADVTDEGKNVPCVDPIEVSVQAQALILGVYVGVELFEILDFATGILFLDLQADDF